MKAKPIENLYAHCKNKHMQYEEYDKKYGLKNPKLGNTEFIRNAYNSEGWKQAITCVMNNYECIPKETK